MTGFLFCDWLTIHQLHPQGGLPIINGGRVVKLNCKALRNCIEHDTGWHVLGFAHEEVEYTVETRIEHEGSYETAVQLRCDGFRVELSGNVSRFGRRDNLFGLSVVECIEKANQILAQFGLPPFSDCERATPHARQDNFTRNGAVITRVDITCNYAAGSPEKARRVLSCMAGQAGARMGKNSAPKAYSNGVTWNEGSKRWYEKLYLKADDLGQWADEAVHQFCRELGIVRHEVSLKSRELADNGLNTILAWARRKEGQAMENVIYARFAEKFHRNQVSYTEMRDIPGRLGEIARDYYNGHDVWNDSAKSKRQRQRWRKDLLSYGIDIATKPNVLRFAQRIQIVELQPVRVPDWYGLEAA